ncbi:hypothetical protein DFJ73DRAFT_876495 [Zopfochytrium polystomum]|nr:hypothetical protein DFJ73DRAFT_876495 [Zopfochytrium polystomum]
MGRRERDGGSSISAAHQPQANAPPTRPHCHHHHHRHHHQRRQQQQVAPLLFPLLLLQLLLAFDGRVPAAYGAVQAYYKGCHGNWQFSQKFKTPAFAGAPFTLPASSFSVVDCALACGGVVDSYVFLGLVAAGGSVASCQCVSASDPNWVFDLASVPGIADSACTLNCADGQRCGGFDDAFGIKYAAYLVANPYPPDASPPLSPAVKAAISGGSGGGGGNSVPASQDAPTTTTSAPVQPQTTTQVQTNPSTASVTSTTDVQQQQQRQSSFTASQSQPTASASPILPGVTTSGATAVASDGASGRGTVTRSPGGATDGMAGDGESTGSVEAGAAGAATASSTTVQTLLPLDRAGGAAGLSFGAFVGIGVAIGLLITAVAALHLILRRRRQQQHQQHLRGESVSKMSLARGRSVSGSGSVRATSRKSYGSAISGSTISFVAPTGRVSRIRGWPRGGGGPMGRAFFRFDDEDDDDVDDRPFYNGGSSVRSDSVRSGSSVPLGTASPTPASVLSYAGAESTSSSDDTSALELGGWAGPGPNYAGPPAFHAEQLAPPFMARDVGR